MDARKAYPIDEALKILKLKSRQVLMQKMRLEGVRGLIISKQDKEVYVAAWALGKMTKLPPAKKGVPRAFTRLHFDKPERWRLSELHRRIKQHFGRPMSWETFLENVLKEGLRTTELKMLNDQDFYHDWADRDEMRKKIRVGGLGRGGRARIVPLSRQKWGRPVTIPAWAIAKGGHELGSSRNSRIPNDLLDDLGEEE